MAQGSIWKRMCYITEDMAASTIVALNRDELLCVSHNTADNFIFNMNDVDAGWKLYSTRSGMQSGSLHFHRYLIGALHKEKIYLFGGRRKMHIFDPQSKQWNVIQNIRYKNDSPIQHFMFSANDEIHLLGGDMNNSHRIWNDKMQTFDLVHEFSEYNYIRDACCVYIAQKEMILLLGGYLSHERNPRTLPHIWKYCIKSRKWTPTTVSFNMYRVSAVVTDDGKHVIMTGDTVNASDSQKNIYILDVNDDDTFKMRKIDIVCPKSTDHVLIKTGWMKGECLISGYVRESHTALDLLPNDLLITITEFYGTQLLHWIEYEARFGYHLDSEIANRYAHYAIPMRDILSKVQSSKKRQVENSNSNNDNEPPSKKRKLNT